MQESFSFFQFLVVCLFLGFVIPQTLANDNGLGALPPMGWNTWCTDGRCSRDYCNETEIKSVATAIIANGMQKLGYTYINLDDCWIAQKRSSIGEITWDPARFPSGLPALISWLHARNLKFGLYCSAGYYTCVGQRPGSYGHYQLDANTFAKWNVDYVKMDWCSHEGLDQETVTTEMAVALNKTGRPMWFNFHCGNPPQEWCQKAGNSYRVGTDHHDNWDNSMECLGAMRGLGKSAGPGHWNDPDFLETGGQGCVDLSKPHCPGQTDDEYRTVFSLWCITNAPLIVATDVRYMTPVMTQALLNSELIQVNQDPLAIAGDIITNWPCRGAPGICQIWGKPLSGGNYVVGLFNADSIVHSITLDFSVIGKRGASLNVRDLWTHQDKGVFTSITVQVEPHQTVVYKLSPHNP